jgi:hypothetical protein
MGDGHLETSLVDERETRNDLWWDAPFEEVQMAKIISSAPILFVRDGRRRPSIIVTRWVSGLIASTVTRRLL